VGSEMCIRDRCQERAWAKDPPQTPPNPQQELITPGVTVLVVLPFEVINVAIQERQARTRLAGTNKSVRQLDLERPAVGQPREGVGECLLAQVVSQAHPFGGH